MAWLATLPAGADRDDGVTEAFRAWSIRDQRGRVRVDREDRAPALERARAGGLRAPIASERPKEAIELAQRISDPELPRDDDDRDRPGVDQAGSRGGGGMARTGRTSRSACAESAAMARASEQSSARARSGMR